MAKKIFNETAYNSEKNFTYGFAPKPVRTKNGLVIGGGLIYPEINFTLPPMNINAETMPEILRIYKEIIDGVLKRAKELYVPGLIVEVEVLPPMTFNPEWAIDVVKTVRSTMYDYEAKYELKSAMRITPVDIREGKDVSHMWHGKHWDKIMQTFEGSARAGADFLSIESVGGKEIHDDAIMFGDIVKSLFALGIVGVRDMSVLWKEINSIAADTGTIAAGDTACGFGNTAMVLADRGYVSKVFAAIVRVMTAVRSLVAYEEGAVGPHKDCGYEGVYIKAITGTPISMEGKSSAVAHLSPVGNIAAAVADLWSNESVQHVKLLGGMAPTISLEQLVYDCRLMNTATGKGQEYNLIIKDLLTESDSKFDPQAYVLRPDFVLNISRELVKERSHYKRTKKAALLAINGLRKAIASGQLIIDQRDAAWLDNMERELEATPDDEQEFVHEMVKSNDSDKFEPQKYDIKVTQKETIRKAG
ncbi:MAG: methanol--corrinoid methyltransferase [Clostridiaceae bacterium]|nr:methanol--corrinoid methyltransferase [Clostridiaceae bacterium]